MSISTIYVQSKGDFSSYIMEWASERGFHIENFEDLSEEALPDGLMLITENQVIERDHFEIHAIYYDRHLPLQKIDINGTLQVAINAFQMWLKAQKCTSVLILGADRLVGSDNLKRFFEKIAH